MRRAPTATAGAAVLSIAMIAAAGPALAGGETVAVQGMAAIVNNDVGMARDKAIDDAKRKAVQQVAGTRVSSQSISENFQLVSDRIYARASGFVKTYAIDKEYKDEGVYYVKMSATVDVDAVAENLDQIFKVKPRVIVMISEQNVGAGNPAYWWGTKGFTSEMDIMQTALIAAWQPKGFKFIDPGMLAGELSVGKAMAGPNPGNAAVLSLSREADADVAIVGKIAVTDAGPVMEGVKMHSYQAVGSLRALNVDTGEIITVADDQAVAAHIDGNQGGRLAIKALAKKLGGALQTAIMSKWTAEAAGAKEIQLVLKGPIKTATLDQVKRFLVHEVRGVESVDLRRRKKNKASLVVQIRGSAMDLGGSFDSKRFDGFTVEVASVTKSAVTIEVKK